MPSRGGSDGRWDDPDDARRRRWLERAEHREAVRGRRRRAWLLAQAADRATLAGVLLDLAERDAVVQLGLRHGGSVTGPVRSLGADFCAVAGDDGAVTMVWQRSVTTIATTTGAPPLGFRRDVESIAAVDVLRDRAGEDLDVEVRGAWCRPLRGRLLRVGADQFTIATEPGGDPTVVAVTAVDAVVLGRR